MKTERKNITQPADTAGVFLGSIPRQSNTIRGLACVALAWPVPAITGTGRIKRGAEAMSRPTAKAVFHGRHGRYVS